MLRAYNARSECRAQEELWKRIMISTVVSASYIYSVNDHAVQQRHCLVTDQDRKSYVQRASRTRYLMDGKLEHGARDISPSEAIDRTVPETPDQARPAHFKEQI